MIDAVAAGQPANRRTVLFLGVGLALGLVGGLIAASFDRPIHTVGWILALLGAATFVVALAVQVVTPSFELIPDGDLPRRKQFVRRIRAEGTWLIRQAFGGMVGFLLGIAATILYKHWFA